MLGLCVMAARRAMRGRDLLESGGPLTGFYAALTDEQRDAVRAVQRELIHDQETRSASAVSLRSRCLVVSGAR